MRNAVLVVMPLLLTATPSYADWRYIKWDMTQDALLTASNGELKSTAPEKESRWGTVFAEGTVVENGRKFKISASGDGGRVYDGEKWLSFPYTVRNIRFEPIGDCSGLLDYLRKTYPVVTTPSQSGYRFSDGGDEIRYTPTLDTCSFRRYKFGRYQPSMH